MKKLSILIIVFSFIGFYGCQKKKDNAPEAQNTIPGIHTIQVVDNIDAAEYTYLKVSENGNQYWIAVPKMDVQKGETLYFSKSLEMKNFHSTTLNKTFDSVLFVSDISTTPVSQSLSTVHQQALSEGKENISIEPLKGGKTVAQIFSEADKLAGKIVRIRAKVTKYNPDIMNRNWIHVQDGTEFNGSYDLLVTSNDIVQLGETIVVEGTVAINKDFGAGYTYKVMLENAKVISNSRPM
jgi:hypothetical protein